MIELNKLAELAGIQTNYYDVWGKQRFVPEATLIFLLEKLGCKADNEDERNESHSRLLLNQNAIPPVKILSENKQVSWAINAVKSCKIRGIDFSYDVLLRHGSLIMPPLKMGYYDLDLVFSDDTHKKIQLIVAPEKCWLPDSMKLENMHKRKRIWGVSAQLYGIRSQVNCGIGDFGDLTELIKKCANYGVDIIGLNPLHAMFPSNPNAFSPYAPSNRLFLNSLYIDVKMVEGYKANPELEEKISEASKTNLVDYPLVANIKNQIFGELFEYFTKHLDKEKYNLFCNEQGKLLEQQALFDALSEHFVNTNQYYNWRDWPKQFQNPDADTVKQFATNHKERIEFYKWLQFIADSQLSRVQNLALQNGMQIGLYRDLAVGSENAGAEIWLDPQRFIAGVTIGAPPDEYNPKGQNWGLPPLNPFTLRQQSYKPFIELLRANMRHARALRIDHAFGLSRLFLIPEGNSAADGAYLNYPFEEILAVLKLESHLNQCIVIGEDLGTFPPNYKQNAADAGLLSYKLLYFERDENGFTPPNRYAAQSLATLSTHDLPTFAGWLKSADIEERAKLQLYPNDNLLNKDKDNRPKDIELLNSALQKVDLNGINIENVERYLARSSAAIVMVQLEDVLNVEVQANLPGTTTERPNWRMKLPVVLENITAKNGPLSRLAKLINVEQQSPLMKAPSATYRLQFHKDFTFYDAAKIIPYLAELGISHVYASPYLEARPGSTHGYDIINHNKFNPELGGEEGFEVFAKALEENGLKHILDFVPNHMGVGNDNQWWQRVLKDGRNAKEAKYFDIDWKPRYRASEAKLLIPALGNHYGEVLAAGELKLKSDPLNNEYYVEYFENRFPVQQEDGPLDMEFINSNQDALHDLIERQHYRLAYWRVASSEINYRRFFDINELAGLRVEEPELFDEMHKLIFSLIEQGKLAGLRIDHIDGLADPAKYCRKLRDKAGENLYLTVEKILASHENLRDDWQIQGTSGYDALNQIAGLFVNARNEKVMDKIYRRLCGDEQNFADMVYEAKIEIMNSSLASEVLSLTLLLKSIAENNRYTRDYTLDNLRQAVKEIIGYFPVYRSYITAKEFGADDKKFIDWAIGKAKKNSQFPEKTIYDFIAGLLLAENDALECENLIFIRKFQQLSGPVMAKGLEDTSFYRFNRLISLNEVGGDPTKFGLPVKAFHQINKQRAEKWPHSMIATATHDTKRGEDSRCRISVLSEIPKLWEKSVTRWMQLNRSKHSEVDGKTVPSANEEYSIYQVLIGSWPNELLDNLNQKLMSDYVTRLKEYSTKALREAKLNSSWAQPNEEYEKAVHNFISGITDITKQNLFLDDFLPLCRRIATRGATNSLSQLVIKLTMPGVPDIYQGTEFWDYSLVDPDNRRAVDYQSRMLNLNDNEPLEQLLTHWQDGKVKQHLLQRILKYRSENKEVFESGSYQTLKITGKHKNHLVAFMRQHAGKVTISICPIFSNKITANEFPLGSDWADTTIKLPKGNFINLINGIKYSQQIETSNLLEKFPIAVLVSNY